MNQIKTGNRVVVISNNEPSSRDAADCRPPVEQRSKIRRIVVIRNGKTVGRRRGR